MPLLAKGRCVNAQAYHPNDNANIKTDVYVMQTVYSLYDANHLKDYAEIISADMFKKENKHDFLVIFHTLNIVQKIIEIYKNQSTPAYI